MKLGPQMADISVDNQRANFNTGPYGDPHLDNLVCLSLCLSTFSEATKSPRVMKF